MCRQKEIGASGLHDLNPPCTHHFFRIHPVGHFALDAALVKSICFLELLLRQATLKANPYNLRRFPDVIHQEYRLVLETAAQVLQRVDDHNAVFLDRLHHLLHQVLRNRYAAAGVGLERAKAVQEDRGAAAGRALLIKADIQAVLVLIFIVHDVLAVIHDELRNLPDVHHLVVLPIRITGPVGGNEYSPVCALVHAQAPGLCGHDSNP